MDRRTFIGWVLGGSAAAPLAVHAQPRGKISRIGYLREGRGPFVLWDAMRVLGWVEGRNVELEPRYADSADQLPGLATELVRLKVDLIFTAGTGPTRAAKEATTTIPIVFSVGGDPVERGLVANMARPNGNLTGYALGLYEEKQLEVLKAALPKISRVAYPDLEGANPLSLNAANAIGVQVVGVAVRNPAEFGSFFIAARSAGADAVLIHDVARLVPHMERIGAEASKSHFPAIGFRRIFAEGGGLLSYAPLLMDSRIRQAAQIDKILRGTKAGELPVEQPTRFELVVNLTAAKALGLTIPQSLLLRADEVIQ